MSDFLNAVNNFSDLSASRQATMFYHFEPWDGPNEDELARHPEKWRHEKCTSPKHTPGGARFQKSACLSHKRIRGLLAANRIGKSIFNAVDGIIMITGELPYSLRVDEGVDTGIKRMLPSQDKRFGKDNVIRWGRIEKATGKILDYNPEAKEDGTWDCGNIIGVGRYPQERIADGSGWHLWICCWGDVRDKLWVPLMKKLIPDHCLDKDQGTQGFGAQKYVFYLQNKRQIRFVTYDQHYDKAEGDMAWGIILDEEVKDRRFFTGVLGHCKWLLMSWTPIHGMTWSYDDIYEPASSGKKPDIEVFHATRYDCPYTDNNDLRVLETELKTYEFDSKVLGQYSRQEGRPYFDYDTTKQWISSYTPRFSLCEILPNKKGSIEEIMASGCYKKPLEERLVSAWEIYEDVSPAHSYFISVDCAKGHDNPEESADSSCAHVFRLPNEKEEAEPVLCATLYTPALNESFAWMTLYGAIYYNNALLAPETKGEDGTAFYVEIKSYPYWFVMPLVSDKTGKISDSVGFDTNSRTRKIAVDKVRKWVNNHVESCKIPNLRTIIEIHEAIFKKGRMDHPESGKSDCLMAFAIGLFVYEEGIHQIKNNRTQGKHKVKDFMPRIILTNVDSGAIMRARGIFGSKAGSNKWQDLKTLLQ